MSVLRPIVAVFIIIGLLSGGFALIPPKKAQADIFTGTDWANLGQQILHTLSQAYIAVSDAVTAAYSYKGLIGDIIRAVLRSLAKRALQKLTEATVNWINSGYEGSPLFLSDPKSFFTDIAQTQVQAFVDDIGYEVNKFPYGKQFALNFINSYKSKLRDNAASSMNKVMSEDNISHFKTDFGSGGWDGWLALTQEPQNNPMGFSYMASKDISLRLAGIVDTPAESLKKEIEQGSGFLSPKRCAEPYGISLKPQGSYTASETEIQHVHDNTYSQVYDQLIDQGLSPAEAGVQAEAAAQADVGNYVADGKAQWEKENVCQKVEVTTPGHVAADQITNALGSKQRQGELAQALGNSLSAVFDALINDLANRGLHALGTLVGTSQTGGTYSNDNGWTYNGESLNDSGSANTSSTGTSSWSQNPDLIIDVSELKKKIDDEITSTQAKLTILEAQENLLGLLPIANKNLDECLPGPDLYWENRLEIQLRSAFLDLEKKAGDTDNSTSADGHEALEDLKYSKKIFVSFVTEKLISALPISSSALDHLSMLKTYMGDNESIKSDVLAVKITIARLNAIKGELAPLPDHGLTQAQKDTLFRSYSKDQTMIAQIPRQEDLDAMKVKQDQIQDYLNETDQFKALCEAQKIPANWELQEAADQPYNGVTLMVNMSTYFNTTDKQQFCDQPIEGGYSYGKLDRGEAGSTVDIPILNAKNIDIDNAGDVSIHADCDHIFWSRETDYKNPNPSPDS